MEEERELRDALCTVPVAFANGHLALPTGPGLGTDLNLDLLQEHDFRPQPTSNSSESLWR